MYRIYDKPEAIKRVQIYLEKIKDVGPYIAPSGVYDSITRNAAIAFQEKYGIEATGIINYITFERLFYEYSKIMEKERISSLLDSFIDFPLFPGRYYKEISHINRIMSRVLDHYGQPHNLTESNFYSAATSKAVELLRGIYLLEARNQIDESFYSALIKDHDSIGEVVANFP